MMTRDTLTACDGRYGAGGWAAWNCCSTCNCSGVSTAAAAVSASGLIRVAAPLVPEALRSLRQIGEYIREATG